MTATEFEEFRKTYRARKQLTSVRIDADILDWLKSQGEGHLTRINDVQALALMNNPFVLKQAEHLAERVAATGENGAASVRRAFRIALQRARDPREERIVTDYLAREGLPNLCRLLVNTNEFIFVD